VEAVGGGGAGGGLAGEEGGVTVHFYGFNLGDYLKKTRHLSLLEDLAYRRMLDLYYRDEKPLQGDAAAIARAIGMREQVAEVSTVLGEFFEETSEGWKNDRADQEIVAYRKKAKAAAKAGRASADKRFNRRATDVEPRSNDRSTDVEPALNDRAPDVQPTNPYPQPLSPTPTPVPENPRGEERGDSLEVAGGGDGGQSQSGDEQTGLFAELCRTTIRSKSKNRRVALSRLACALDSQGMKPQELRSLWKRACQESAKEPGGLLLHWIENGWREKVQQ